MEVWYWWLLLAIAIYVLGRERFKEGYTRFLVDIVSILLMMTSLVIMVEDSGLSDVAKNMAGLWLSVFSWAVLGIVVVFIFKRFLPDVFDMFVGEIKGAFRGGYK